MKRKSEGNIIILLFLTALFSVLGMHQMLEKGRINRMKTIYRSEEFRRQELGREMLQILSDRETGGTDIGRSKLIAVYLLETDCGAETLDGKLTEKVLREKAEEWRFTPEWKIFLRKVMSVWEDVKYFPLPRSALHPEYETDFENSWMEPRTYGGKRGHEGTDIMTAQDIPGRYPVISMTDGVVLHKGWLPKGGWRIGIQAPHGGYYYYAHLDSYASLKEGDCIRAGQLLGFAGNSGYGEEGTTGKFATHLHIGIYLNPDEAEVSVNPYWILKYLEQNKLTYTFE